MPQVSDVSWSLLSMLAIFILLYVAVPSISAGSSFFYPYNFSRMSLSNFLCIL